MKNKVFLGIAILFLVIGSSLALDSSILPGLARDDFKTNDILYLTHNVAIFCEGTLKDAEVDVYVFEDRDWSDGDELTEEVVKTTIATDSNGKLESAAIWESLEVGSYDVIVDTNKNGKYESGGPCQDLIDDDALTGFTVEAAEAETTDQTPEDQTTDNQTSGEGNQTDTENQTTEEEAPVEDTTPEEEPTPAAAQEPPSTNPPEDDKPPLEVSGTDLAPFLIIGMAILIGTAIIAFTLYKIR